jgi:hypothetical protein
MLVQEEARLKQQEYHLAHLVSQGAKKKFKRGKTMVSTIVNGHPKAIDQVHEKI